jgi:hypothetical protein
MKKLVLATILLTAPAYAECPIERGCRGGVCPIPAGMEQSTADMMRDMQKLPGLRSELYLLESKQPRDPETAVKKLEIYLIQHAMECGAPWYTRAKAEIAMTCWTPNGIKPVCAP